MSVRSPEEQKKAICTSLVSVIRASNLRDQIDVKRFYSTISSKFSALYRDEVFDLGPIWGALADRYAHEDLYGLFLKFGEVSQELGVGVRQAPTVEALPRNSQIAYLADFSNNRQPSVTTNPGTDPRVAGIGTSIDPKIAGMGTPVDPKIAGMGTPVDAKVANMGTPANAVPAATTDASISGARRMQSAGDADGGEDLSQRISWALAQALKATVAGEAINTGELQFLVTSKFDDLFQAGRFNINPVLQNVLAIPGVEESGIFVGVMRFRSVLISMGYDMTEPEFQLTEDEKQTLLTAAKHQGGPDNFRAGGVNEDGLRIGELPGDAIEPVPAKPRKRDEQLAQYNLHGRAEEKTTSPLVRIAIMLVVFVIAAISVWYLRPVRHLAAGDYKAIFPVTEVMIANGSFVGFLDDAKWLTMTQTEKNVALQKLETKLKKEGYLSADNRCQSMCRQVAIMDTSDRLIIFDIRGGRLKAAK